MITNQGSVLVTGEQEVTTSVEGAPVTPFAGVTLTDPTPGATDTVTIDVSATQGKLTDGPGYSGLTSDIDYITHSPTYVSIRYTLPSGTPSQVSAELDHIIFTPSAYSDTTAPVTGLELTASSSQPNNTLVTNSNVPETITETEVQVVQSRSVSIDPTVTYKDDVFTLTGTAQSVAGVTSVEITAVVNGTTTDLGPATLNEDGTFTFTDAVGSNIQGFITATETDGAGGTVSARADFSLQGGLSNGSFTARQTRYTPDGNTETAVTAFREDGSRRVNIMNSGAVYQSNFFDTFINHEAPNNTFVFTPNHGLDVVNQFRFNGTDHDTLSFKGSDFGNDIAAVLQNAHNAQGGVVILDPTSGDTVKLAGITKAQLVHNQSDFTFHA